MNTDYSGSCFILEEMIFDEVEYGPLEKMKSQTFHCMWFIPNSVLLTWETEIRKLLSAYSAENFIRLFLYLELQSFLYR